MSIARFSSKVYRINSLSINFSNANVVNSILKLRQEGRMLPALKLDEKVRPNPRDTVSLD